MHWQSETQFVGINWSQMPVQELMEMHWCTVHGHFHSSVNYVLLMRVETFSMLFNVTEHMYHNVTSISHILHIFFPISKLCGPICQLYWWCHSDVISLWRLCWSCARLLSDSFLYFLCSALYQRKWVAENYNSQGPVPTGFWLGSSSGRPCRQIGGQVETSSQGSSPPFFLLQAASSQRLWVPARHIVPLFSLLVLE